MFKKIKNKLPSNYNLIVSSILILKNKHEAKNEPNFQLLKCY